jgi:hypothetical protein
MDLEPATTEFNPVADQRPRIPPPLPAQLVAIADVTLQSVAGIEKELDGFYAGLLGLARDREAEASDPAQSQPVIVYRAENFRLRIEILERPPQRLDFRALGILVPSLAELAQRLTDGKIEFIRQRGLWPGMESLILTDPAGNPVEVTTPGWTI